MAEAPDAGSGRRVGAKTGRRAAGATSHSRAAGAAPDAARLQEQALAHVARYAGTAAGLLRVLRRAVDRWATRARHDGVPADAIAEAAARARAEAAAVVARLASSGAVNDAAFAASRARRLARSGRSRRSIAGHLAAKGVAPETARAALPAADDTAELAAALAYAKRRHIGPFRRVEPDADGAGRELAMLARAGFPQAIARHALAMEPVEALGLIAALRRS